MAQIVRLPRVEVEQETRLRTGPSEIQEVRVLVREDA
eukprot:CAMPEP_0170315494 /NCGR_PEP_ID=MMETSP0116_2-20130129/58348_1 /TAXON_ID=400756 /ORGANISM="Durinskia baltica, Strain CSIRO CS-38" /LENGTH=36 /DNA_ID= /DNA_START= /DNA_END= /DNA_ORIENTATION=